MTRPDRPDDDHDDALHQAWRASSREAPPPALDAAILAAAHRAVGSAPRTAGGEAVRPPRWWMPFAAAAVIGAVAVGVVQLAPHESAIDVTSGESAKPDARVAMAPAAPPAAGAGIAVDTTGAAKREASPPVAVASAPPPAPAPSPAPRAHVDAAQPSLAATSAPQPFPAAKVARQEPAQDSAAANPASANRMADAAIPRESAEARASPRSDAQGRVAASPPSPPTPAAARAAAGAPATPAPATMAAPTAERARDGFAGNLAQVAKQRPAPSAEALERAKDPEAWIVRIRKLRDGGREAEAIKELHEFDAVVPDAAQRMPSELRRLMQRDPVN